MQINCSYRLETQAYFIEKANSYLIATKQVNKTRQIYNGHDSPMPITYENVCAHTIAQGKKTPRDSRKKNITNNRHTNTFINTPKTKQPGAIC